MIGFKCYLIWNILLYLLMFIKKNPCIVIWKFITIKCHSIWILLFSLSLSHFFCSSTISVHKKYAKYICTLTHKYSNFVILSLRTQNRYIFFLFASEKYEILLQIIKIHKKNYAQIYNNFMLFFACWTTQKLYKQQQQNRIQKLHVLCKNNIYVDNMKLI